MEPLYEDFFQLVFAIVSFFLIEKLLLIFIFKNKKQKIYLEENFNF